MTSLYRTLKIDTWKDEWFQDRTPLAKLVFLYLMSCSYTTACGVTEELTAKTMAFDTGLTPKQLSAALVELQDRVVCWPGHNFIWVKNFYKHQRANSSWKFEVAARKALTAFPPEVRAAVGEFYPELAARDTPQPPKPSLPIANGYSTDRVSIPLGVTDNSKQITETDISGAILDHPTRTREAETSQPAPKPIRAVPKTTTPDEADLAWFNDEVTQRAHKAGFDPATLLAEIDIGDQTARRLDFEPAPGKATPSWRNWMRLEIDKRLAALKAATNGAHANGNRNLSAAEREEANLRDIFRARALRNGGEPDTSDPPGREPAHANVIDVRAKSQSVAGSAGPGTDRASPRQLSAGS